jgi:hypothetical protein
MGESESSDDDNRSVGAASEFDGMIKKITTDGGILLDSDDEDSDECELERLLSSKPENKLGTSKNPMDITTHSSEINPFGVDLSQEV